MLPFPPLRHDPFVVDEIGARVHDQRALARTRQSWSFTLSPGLSRGPKVYQPAYTFFDRLSPLYLPPSPGPLSAAN